MASSQSIPPTSNNAVETETTGALNGDGTSISPLAVNVDGVTVTVNGSNQLVSEAGGTVEVAAAGALSGDGSSGDPLSVVVDGVTITINGSNELEAASSGGTVTTSSPLSGDGSGGDPVTLASDVNVTLAGLTLTDLATFVADEIVNVLSEDFEGSFPPSGWDPDADPNGIGTEPWTQSGTVSHGGTKSAQAGAVPASSGYVGLYFSFTLPSDGTLSFWSKIDADDGPARLYAYDVDTGDYYKQDGTVGTSANAGITGNQDWVQTTIELQAGDHEFGLYYEKQSASAVGADTGWVDDVVVSFVDSSTVEFLVPVTIGRIDPALDDNSNRLLHITGDGISLDGGAYIVAYDPGGSMTIQSAGTGGLILTMGGGSLYLDVFDNVVIDSIPAVTTEGFTKGLLTGLDVTFESLTVTKPVTSATSITTTATITTAVDHHFTTADTVTIAGADQAEYNGDYTITVTGATTFTYTFAGSATSPATGTLTASKVIA